MRLDVLSLLQSLEDLLNAETGERKVVQFLAKHPQLLCDYFVSPRGHCQYSPSPEKVDTDG